MSEQSAEQLSLLNDAWVSSCDRSPWARVMRINHDLPQRFGSWRQFDDQVPIVGREELSKLLAEVEVPGRDFSWLATGGSTSEPFRFPSFRRDDGSSRRLMHEARVELGVAPRDRLFLLWGHAHLFGKGFAGLLARLRRTVADRVLGYCRFSAYRLSTEELRRAGDAMLRHRARYVIGYSSALDRFARANADRAEAFARLDLKVVIATAEGFPAADSRSVIESCFGAPVVMEYGSMETGIIAYERLGRPGFDVFWRRHRLEALDSSSTERGQELVVTSLYPRALPLLRYRLGDLVEPEYEEGDIVGLATVTGRCNDIVRLRDGTPIHSELVTHLLRAEPGVTGFQVRNREARDPKLRYEGAVLGPDARARLRAQLESIHPGFSNVAIEHVAALERSTAGKLPLVVEGPE